MGSLRRRLIGAVLLVVAVAAVGLATAVVPTIVAESATAPAGVVVVAPSSFSWLAAPALIAVAAVLLVAGGAALAGIALSARTTLLAPAVGTVVAAGAVVVAAPAAVWPALTATETLATLSGGPPGTVAAGGVAGATVAPVVRAATTEDTITLLVGATLLFAAVATASEDLLALAAGGVAGVVAVGALWMVDPATWRP